MTRTIEAQNFAGNVAEAARVLEHSAFDIPLAQCAKLINQKTRDHFTSSASPTGADWPARKVDGDGHPLLMDTGALLQAATGGGAGHIERIGDRDLEVGLDAGVIKYARVHQHGYARRNIPQREYLGLDNDGPDIDQMAEFVADEALEQVLLALDGYK